MFNFDKKNMKEFVKIEGYPGYLISRDGTIISLKRKNKVSLKKTLDSYGYYVVGLYNNGIVKILKVHRLVAITFICNKENKETVNHINGIKTDNRVENLEWCTSAENTKHANKTGLTDIKGENHVLSILNNEKVLLIRHLYYNEKLRKSQISRKLSINWSTISDVVNKRTWKHI